MILKYFTANIDNLEEKIGWHVKGKKLVHGSKFGARCVKTGCEAKRKVLYKDEIKCEHCRSPLKPDVTFFGEAKPYIFEDGKNEFLKSADLFIIVGANLDTNPLRSIFDEIKQLPDGVPIVDINTNPK